jgi:hypothetical protein
VFLTLGLNSSTLDTTRRFYERLGLNFTIEKHGNKGLSHFSTIAREVPVEVYPTVSTLPSSDHFFIGFEVDDPISLGKELIEDFGGISGDPPIPNTSSGIVTLRDPNGLLIRLFPKSAA